MIYIDAARDEAEEAVIVIYAREEYSEDKEIKIRKVIPKGSKHFITHNFI
jgi:hypothetical protein